VITAVLSGVVLVLLLVVWGWLAVLTNLLSGLRDDLDALTGAGAPWPPPATPEPPTAPAPVVQAAAKEAPATNRITVQSGVPAQVAGRHRPTPRPHTGVAP